MHQGEIGRYKGLKIYQLKYSQILSDPYQPIVPVSSNFFYFSFIYCQHVSR